MKFFPIKKIPFLILIALLVPIAAMADGGLRAFYKIGTMKGDIKNAVALTKKALTSEDANFQIIGEYQPGKNPNLYVLAFTRTDLLDIAEELKNRSVIASVLRVGLYKKQNSDSVVVTLLNPEYIFYGYVQKKISKYEIQLAQISTDVKIAISSLGRDFHPFGGESLSENEIREFRFMASMPGFNDPIVINEFDSFDQGVQKIQMNLSARKGGTFKVFELVFKDEKIAVWGVGLLDQRMGEEKILNELGQSHLAAMPYELVLIGTQATILHAKYRFPFFWSDLTMSEFRNVIYRMPREIEETMKQLTR